MLLASLLNVAGFSTTAAAVISDVKRNGVHVVAGLPACCCRLNYFVALSASLHVWGHVVALIPAVAGVAANLTVMLLMSSLLLLVTGVTAAACVTAVACIPAVACISAIAGVPFVPDVLIVASIPIVAGVPGVVGVHAVAGVLLLLASVLNPVYLF